MMKKFLLSLIALLGMSAYAMAQDEIRIPDVKVIPGESAYIQVYFDITSDELYRDFQFDIELPEGIEFKYASIGDACTKYHSAASGLQFVCDATAPQGTEVTELCLKSGVLANIEIEASADLSTNLVGRITGVEISNNAGQAAIRKDAISFNIVLTNIIELDEESTVVPVVSNDKVNVKLKRTIKAGEWSTLCLPFGMTAEQVEEFFGVGTQFAEFVGYTVDGGNPSTSSSANANSLVVNFESWDWSEDGIYSNVPYIVKSKNNVEEISLESVELETDEENAYTAYEYKRKKVGFFYGLLHAGEYVPANSLFLSGGNFYYSTGKTKIKGFRGYFTLNDVLADLAVSDVKMQFDVITKIDGVRLVNTEGAVYTIDGKFIGRDVDLKKLQKGIYVIDGKKVAIK